MKRLVWMPLLAMALAGTAVATPLVVKDDTAAQITRHAGDHRMIVLGEYHGTRETPLLVARLMEHYSRDGGAVRLGLEMPTSENAALAGYLRSNGDADAREALRTTPFWTVTDDQHDGRRSRDTLALVEAVRALRVQGRDVAVAGYDVETDSTDSSEVRDLGMARHLRQQFDAMPDTARMLVLTGNVHAMRQRPDDGPAEMQTPMASRLLDLPLYSVRLEALRGAFWGCNRTCRALPLIDRPPREPMVDIDADRQYDLVVFMPVLSVGTLVD